VERKLFVLRIFPIVEFVLVFSALLGGLIACGNDASTAVGGAPASGGSASRKGNSEAPGSIVFTANGEDFVRRGFVDRQGWHITFENLFVNIVEPTAYVPDGDRQAVLHGSHWIDLAEGGPDAEPIAIDTVEDVPPANYQSLRFSLRRASGGPFAGSTIVMIGTAERDDVEVPFSISLDEEMVFDGREGYVGEELKGLLQPGSATEVEMTFHFDHVFGDKEAGKADHINAGSVGFDFFNAFAEGGVVDVRQGQLKGAEGYDTLVRALWTLGHLGEGHCGVSGQTSVEDL
jgi:hypothetical protein